VLDRAKVTEAAQRINYAVNVRTTNAFNGTKELFASQTKEQADRLPSTIIINIDTKARHLAIYGGSEVPLKSEQYEAAISAFRDNIHGSDYTSATVAALNSLAQALENGKSYSTPSSSYDSESSYGSYDPGWSRSDSSGWLANMPFGMIACCGLLFFFLVSFIIGLIRQDKGSYPRKVSYGGFYGGSSYSGYDVGGSSFDSSSSLSYDSGSSYSSYDVGGSSFDSSSSSSYDSGSSGASGDF
jgi:hypothetical protein